MPIYRLLKSSSLTQMNIYLEDCRRNKRLKRRVVDLTTYRYKHEETSNLEFYYLFHCGVIDYLPIQEWQCLFKFIL